MKKAEFKELLVAGRKSHRPLCFFHRTISGLQGSDDLSKLQERVNNENVDGIEIDIQSTVDKEIIVRHDFAVDTNRGYLWVKDVPFKQIRARHTISDCPTLEEFFAALGSTQKIIDIEIKQPGVVSTLIHKYKRNHAIFQRMVLTTMYEEIVNEINECDPTIAWMYGYPRDKGKNLSNRWWTQPIVKTIVQYMKFRLPSQISTMIENNPTDFFSFYHKVITKELVEIIRSKNKFTIGATISLNNDTGYSESLRTVQRMIQDGVDLVKTDYPDIYPQALQTQMSEY